MGIRGKWKGETLDSRVRELEQAIENLDTESPVADRMRDLEREISGFEARLVELETAVSAIEDSLKERRSRRRRRGRTHEGNDDTQINAPDGAH